MDRKGWRFNQMPVFFVIPFGEKDILYFLLDLFFRIAVLYRF